MDVQISPITCIQSTSERKTGLHTRQSVRWVTGAKRRQVVDFDFEPGSDTENNQPWCDIPSTSGRKASLHQQMNVKPVTSAKKKRGVDLDYEPVIPTTGQKLGQQKDCQPKSLNGDTRKLHTGDDSDIESSDSSNNMATHTGSHSIKKTAKVGDKEAMDRGTEAGCTEVIVKILQSSQIARQEGN